jgi:hypothetical protein
MIGRKFCCATIREVYSAVRNDVKGQNVNGKPGSSNNFGMDQTRTARVPFAPSFR